MGTVLRQPNYNHVTGFFIESFPQLCFEEKWLQNNRLRADKNESRSFLVVDIQGHQLGVSAFCNVTGNN